MKVDTDGTIIWEWQVRFEIKDTSSGNIRPECSVTELAHPQRAVARTRGGGGFDVCMASGTHVNS